jgi:catechol 2,3-dioxygenase-like lactoylglutathione lyase family enzyme
MHIYASTVYVSDQDRALDFYVNRLGWEKRDDSNYGDGGRWVVVAPPGEKGGLSILRPSATETPGATVGGNTGISLITTDIKAAYAEMSAKGVQFQGPPQQMPWGEQATWFSDPDGNSFFLVEVR